MATTQMQAQNQSSDSIDDQDPHSKTDEKKTKSRRPANTAFRQQRLKAWQPILTPKTVLPLFFAIGIIFAPIGGVLLWASAQVDEIMIDYTHCFDQAPDFPLFKPLSSDLVTKNFKSSGIDEPTTWSKKTIDYEWGPGAVVPTIECTLNFKIPSNMTHPVLFYYKLTNFYQNHRRYAKSFSIDQLSGKRVSADSIAGGDCAPLTTEGVGSDRKPYYPCGLAANSQFNDTFSSPVLLNPSKAQPGEVSRVYQMENNKGISWASDRALYGKTQYNWSEVAVPPNWRGRYPKNYTEEHHPDLMNDEAFQVWMRLAGLPVFSKLAQRNDVLDMEKGTYSLKINHNFNVVEYGGTKSIIISTRTVMGGKNPFLGIAYVIVGGICILLGVLFTVTHLFKPRKLGDHTYLTWNNDQSGGGAVTSGREGGGEA